MATGMGARYPRFGADVNQAAGSYGGVAFMLQAVLFVVVIIVLVGWPSSVYVMHQFRRIPLSAWQQLWMAGCFVAAGVVSVTLWITSMRAGVRALESMG